MIIRNVMKFVDDGSFIQGNIRIKGNRIDSNNFETHVPKECDIEMDGLGLFAIPGLLDIHLHGCMNYDFCDGTVESIQKIAEYEESCGITAICPATMTLPNTNLTKIFKAAGDYKNKLGADLIGIHMEGPFINASKCGAQNATYIQKPNIKLFQQLNSLCGNIIKIVDIAPEEEGSTAFIQNVKESTVISIAHTSANYEIAANAFHEGVTHVSHVFNAMPLFHHREPGVIGAAFDCNKVFVELICDGIHIHPSMVRAAFMLFSPDRIVFVSDSMEATGMPDGRYHLGGQIVEKQGNHAVLLDGTLAGSVTNLFDCMKNAVCKIGIPMAQAIKAATVNPAKSIGVYGKYGTLTEGAFANILLIDEQFNLKFILSRGKIIYNEIS